MHFFFFMTALFVPVYVHPQVLYSVYTPKFTVQSDIIQSVFFFFFLSLVRHNYSEANVNDSCCQTLPAHTNYLLRSRRRSGGFPGVLFQGHGAG